MWWCNIYGGFLFSLGAALLIVAAAAAVIEAFVVARARIEAARQARTKAQESAALAVDGVDPVKFFEALKGLLVALKDLPTWIALFGAGLALVFLAGQRVPACSGQVVNASGGGAGGSNAMNNTTTNTTTNTTK